MKYFLNTNVLEAAKKRIRFIFKEFDDVVVWVSGGKDSTVIFNISLEIARELNRLPLKVAFIDQESEWKFTIDMMRKIMYHKDVTPYWYQIPFRLTNSLSRDQDYLHCWCEEEKDLWPREKEEISIKENTYGVDRFADLFEEIQESIKRFGYQSPILVDKNMIIVLGHARFKALLDLKGKLDGMIKYESALQKKIKDKDEAERVKVYIENLKMVNSGKVPVIIADDLSEKKAKEYRITDNKLNEKSSWDNEKLKVELRELETAIGFSEEELSRLLKIAEVSMPDFTPSEMKGAERKMETKFDNVTKEDNDRKIEFMCPHCLEKYSMNKEDVQKKLSGNIR